MSNNQMSVEDAARALSLRTSPSTPTEMRIDCPVGCKSPAHDLCASANTDPHGAYGAWHCYKCEENGSLFFLLKDDPRFEQVVRSMPKERIAPKVEKPKNPVNVEAAWAVIGGLKNQNQSHITSWAKRRGWPDYIARNVWKVPEVGVVDDINDDKYRQNRSLMGHKDYSRVVGHCTSRELRRLVFGLRDNSGSYRSYIRRGLEQNLEPKGKRAAKSHAWVERDDVVMFGNFARWFDRVAQGELGLIVEGEIDYTAAKAAMFTPERPEDRRGWKKPPYADVIGANGAHSLIEIARLIADHLKHLPEPDADDEEIVHRILFVPHLGDKGRSEAVRNKGLKAAQKAMGILNSVGSRQNEDIKVIAASAHLPVNDHGEADFADVMERYGVGTVMQVIKDSEPIVVRYGRSDVWCWGENLIRYYENPKQEGETLRNDVSSRCRPIAITHQIEDETWGVAFKYRDRRHNVRVGHIEAGGLVDAKAGAVLAREAVNRGVDIKPRMAGDWISALSAWQATAADEFLTVATRTPGWHHDPEGDGWIYAHTENKVFGGRWVYNGCSTRGSCYGTLDAWREGVDKLRLMEQPALAVCLGASFAGALLRRVGRKPFLLNIFGPSSSGKSIATQAGLSIWGCPTRPLHWGSTNNAIENDLVANSGTCVVLDEMTRKKPEDVAGLIHRFGLGVTKGRSNIDGETNKRERHWSLVGLSQSERSMSGYLGSNLQGGHTVRMVDVEIEPGEGTRDDIHADEIELWMQGNYGHAGCYWVEYLAGLDDEQWKRISELVSHYTQEAIHALGGNSEDSRIAKHIGVIFAALDEAARASLIPRCVFEDHLAWTCEKVNKVREDFGRSPEERAFQHLITLVATEPSRFPTESEYRSRPRSGGGIVGMSESRKEIVDGPGDIAEEVNVRTGRLMISETTLKGWETLAEVGTTPRNFIKWLKGSGKIESSKKERLFGIKQLQMRWHTLKVLSERAFEETKEEGVF